MKLTGKCKEDFENWLYKQDWYDTLDYGGNNANMWVYSPYSMQYGVYVDFFDSVGILVNVKRNQNGYFSQVNGMTTWKKQTTIRGDKTRPEARTKAIEKANEIYNEKTKKRR